LAIYVDCKTWKCLPQAGGLYDQSPELLEAFTVIENEVNRYNNTKIREQNNKVRRK